MDQRIQASFVFCQEVIFYPCKGMSHLKKIVIIGAGNMATQLCINYHRAGHPFYQVYNRTIQNALHLKSYLTGEITDHIDQIDPYADIYLIAVKDTIISSIAQLLHSVIENQDAIVVHCSGSMPSTLLSDHGHYGSFYPLQSVRKDRDIDFRNVPILICSNSVDTTEELIEIASIISDHAYETPDALRSKLHMPAVWVNNFVNYMYHQAYQYCQSENLPFEYLHALMQETTQRIIDGEPPRDVQTGPAIRNDKETIKNHIALLNENQASKNLYKYISKNISRDQDLKR